MCIYKVYTFLCKIYNSGTICAVLALNLLYYKYMFWSNLDPPIINTCTMYYNHAPYCLVLKYLHISINNYVYNYFHLQLLLTYNNMNTIITAMSFSILCLLDICSLFICFPALFINVYYCNLIYVSLITKDRLLISIETVTFLLIRVINVTCTCIFSLAYGYYYGVHFSVVFYIYCSNSMYVLELLFYNDT